MEQTETTTSIKEFETRIVDALGSGPQTLRAITKKLLGEGPSRNTLAIFDYALHCLLTEKRASYDPNTLTFTLRNSMTSAA